MKVTKITFATDEGELNFTPATEEDFAIAESIALGFSKEALAAGDIQGIIFTLPREKGISVGMGGSAFSLMACYHAIKDNLAGRYGKEMVSMLEKAINPEMTEKNKRSISVDEGAM